MKRFFKPAVPMTRKAQDAAASFAVAYQAYIEACKAFDDAAAKEERTVLTNAAHSVVCWAFMLSEAQNKVGVSLVNAGNLAYREREAKAALSPEAQAAWDKVVPL